MNKTDTFPTHWELLSTDAYNFSLPTARFLLKIHYLGEETSLAKLLFPWNLNGELMLMIILFVMFQYPESKQTMKLSYHKLDFFSLLNQDLNWLFKVIVRPILPAPTFCIPWIGHLLPLTQQLHFCGSLFSQSMQECDKAAWWQDGRYLPARKKKKCLKWIKYSLTLWPLTFVVLKRRTLWRNSSVGGCRYTSVYVLFSQFCLLSSITYSIRRDRDNWKQWDAGYLSWHCETTWKSTTPREHPLEKRTWAGWNTWAVG